MSVPEAVWNEIKALKASHAELAAKVGELRNWLVTMAVDNTDRDERIAALESPAPAPEPVCQCGHPKHHHWNHEDGCFDPNCEETERCQKFVPTAEPEPAPLDPGALKVATR